MGKDHKNPQLKHAMAWLKGEMIIRKDSDVYNTLNVPKQTFLHYTQGDTEAPKSLLKKIEESFLKPNGCTWDDFAGLRKIEKPEPVTTEELNSFLVTKVTRLEAAIGLLSAKMNALTKLNEELLTEIKSLKKAE